MSSYNTKVYRKPGGDELIVGSGGRILVESGASLDVDGDSYVVTEPDDVTIELDGDNKLAVKDEGIDLAKLASEVTDLLDILAAIPTDDPADDGETIWLHNGVLKVSGASG